MIPNTMKLLCCATVFALALTGCPTEPEPEVETLVGRWLLLDDTAKQDDRSTIIEFREDMTFTFEAAMLNPDSGAVTETRPFLGGTYATDDSTDPGRLTFTETMEYIESDPDNPVEIPEDERETFEQIWEIVDDGETLRLGFGVEGGDPNAVPANFDEADGIETYDRL